MPKFEKVDDHTLKVIVEKSSDVPLAQLMENKLKIVAEINRMQDVLDNINEMLMEADKLGITVKPVKKVCKACKGTKRLGDKTDFIICPKCNNTKKEKE